MKALKKIGAGILAVGLLAAVLSGCSYGGIAMHGDNAVILRNDGFLFGALRKVYICQVTPAGLTNCTASEEKP